MLEYSQYYNYEGKPKKLIVMLHGYGSNKDDLINLAPELSKFMPSALFVSPNAPFDFEGMPRSDAKQWFSLVDRSKKTLMNEIKVAEKYIIKFILEQLKKYNLIESDLCLLGFSQGTMLALYLIMQTLLKPKLIIGYSGRLFENEWNCDFFDKITKILLIHGEEDEVVPVEDMLSAVEMLKKYKFQVTNHISRYLAHGIDNDGIRIGGNFLENNF
ncbi:alpha/beta hydrolase [Candidatus Aquarickettsia rohweri]|uniref:Phospholipase n=1 Tax=Candidatus Aquarickettsia rohweri TaxID=2602574 RepID=A0A429XSG9_9RICK|nr:phospholipase [Candidatus Aquarickettsia rohweri]RST69795.1 phospholipase [Candidatus Aquarickettsia rohweri]